MNNQPKDLFEEDTVRILNFAEHNLTNSHRTKQLFHLFISFYKALRKIGRTPNYFVEQYGKCMGVNRDGPSEELGLVYEVDDTVRNSLVTLEVSADDMILIYNR